jgi:hypothetical protein
MLLKGSVIETFLLAFSKKTDLSWAENAQAENKSVIFNRVSGMGGLMLRDL